MGVGLETVLLGLGIFSAVTFLVSLLLLPWLLSRLPADYFIREPEAHPWHRLLQPRALLRNALGLTILLAGIAMLALPGQGLLTMLVGLAVMEFPGKFSLERWLVTRRGVMRALNWLRHKAKQPPLRF